MGEAIIAGRSSNGGIKVIEVVRTEIITENKQWVCPLNIVNNEISVRVFGGDGGVNYGSNGYDAGGGGGNMNNGTISVNPGNSYEIYVSAVSKLDGGTTSFSTLLSATGGSAGNDGVGGNGGSGGAGGKAGNSTRTHCNGGSGTYGGGGGSFATINSYSYGSGGNGGLYGGGGGGSIQFGPDWAYIGAGGRGGLYGGNAGSNGVNTIGMGLEFEGAGVINFSNRPVNTYRYSSEFMNAYGGGGYGGNGGGALDPTINYSGRSSFNGGGGGGYGGNGGLYGGGGGYGGDGGWYSGGGGGGYGLGGHGGQDDKNYGYGTNNGGIAGGGSGVANSYGGPGVCIIQYKEKVLQMS